MNFWRSTVLVKFTLLFFSVMQLHNPAYAQNDDSGGVPDLSLNQKTFPITYVEASEFSGLVREYQRKGYIVREVTLAQLSTIAQSNDVQPGSPGSASASNRDTPQQTCNRQAEQSAKSRNPAKLPESSATTDGRAAANSGDCSKEKNSSRDGSSSRNADDSAISEPGAEPTPQSPPQPPPQPVAAPHASVGIHGDLPYGSGGGGGDGAKIFFLIIGFVVVAAFIVYAGKYIADIARSENHTLWWEVAFNSTFLSTDAGQYGDFYGAKLATGFVSSDLIQLSLIGEVGKADINLLINETSNPQALNFLANYWMLGGAVRMHLTTKLVNPSYLYLEFMGGTTDHSATDTISAARLGASFGLNDYIRLGGSFGAQYIGLNEDQGFVNDGDNYWFTIGLELGVRF